MVQQVTPDTAAEVIYPESDGLPMSDNTIQFNWIVRVKENLEIIFASQNDVFVAGDLLWYPIEGDIYTKQAPDAMVVFGRPKGDRGSYIQCKEDNIPPQVVFEILSPSNSMKEMAKKLDFYQRFGVEEYYIYDPYKNDTNGWLRSGEKLEIIEEINSWVSPRLGIRFETTPQTLEIYRPDGRKFLTPVELEERAKEAEQRLEQAEQRLEQAEQRLGQAEQVVEQERQAKENVMRQLQEEQQRYQDLLKQLQERGINLD
jgi:Uma2 family endonuclease